MNLQNVVPVGQNEYVVETSKDLVALSSIARIGSRVLCLEDNKVYVYMDVNKWETALDLAGGPSNATHWVGVTTTALTDGATTDPIVINGENVVAELGAIVSYGPDEFVWNGSAWQKFGGNSETFRVTVTNNTADRTFADTLAAFSAGKFVYAIKGSELYLVDYGDNNRIVFYKFGANNVTFSSSPGAVNRVQQGFVLQSDDTIVEQNKFILPQITSSDNGKLLGVNNGQWTKVDPPSGLPSVAGSDNGKVLKVNNGTWGASNEDTLIVHYTYDSSTQTYSSDYTYEQLTQFNGPVIGQWSDMDATGIGFANYNLLLRIIQYKCYIPSFGQYFILTHKSDNTIGMKYESASDFFVVDYRFDVSNQQWTCWTPLEDLLAAYQQHRNIIAKLDDDGIIFWLNNMSFNIDYDNGTSTIVFSSVTLGNTGYSSISENYLYHVINAVQMSTIRIDYDTKDTYSIPSGGIPESDLSSNVQEKLISQESIARMWDSSFIYNVSDLVMHNGVLYESDIDSNTDEPGNSAQWSPVSIASKYPGAASTDASVLMCDGGMSVPYWGHAIQRIEMEDLYLEVNADVFTLFSAWMTSAAQSPGTEITQINDTPTDQQQLANCVNYIGGQFFNGVPISMNFTGGGNNLPIFVLAGGSGQMSGSVPLQLFSLGSAGIALFTANLLMAPGIIALSGKILSILPALD